MSTKEEIDALRMKLQLLEKKKANDVQQTTEEAEDVEEDYEEEEELEGLDLTTGEREETPKKKMPIVIKQKPKIDEEEVRKNLENIQRDVERLQNNGIFRVELLFQLITLNNTLAEINKKIEG